MDVFESIETCFAYVRKRKPEWNVPGNMQDCDRNAHTLDIFSAVFEIVRHSNFAQP